MQPLDYLNSTAGLIWTIACVISGFVLTALGYLMLNRIPASWLCDYGETPSEELLSGKRFSYLRSGIAVSVLMSLCLVLCRLQFNKGFDIYFILLSLIIFTAIMIAVSDLKYQIIPDQFTIAVGIFALTVSVYDIVRGYNILHCAWWSPLAGAGIGAVVMMLIDFIGMLVYHRDGMGFGDVKLFFAVGILTGFPGTIYAFIISIITATVFFVAILIIRRFSPDKEEEQQSIQTDDSASSEDDPEESSGSEKKDISDDTDISKHDGQDEDETDEADTSGYLAFGPYIALAVGVYCALFDLVQYLAGLYLSLFK